MARTSAALWPAERDTPVTTDPDREHMFEPLTPAERERQLRSLADWSYENDSRSLRRRIQFETFEDVIVAVVRIGVAAERMDHHPSWSNIYDILDIRLTTHDAGDVSMLDFDFARLIDLIVTETKNDHVRKTEHV